MDRVRGLIPGEARNSFGQHRFTSSLSSRAECSASYGRAVDLTGPHITVAVEVFGEQANAADYYHTIKRVDLAQAGGAATPLTRIGPATGYAYTDTHGGITLVSLHHNLIVRASANCMFDQPGTVAASGIRRLTNLATALIAAMPTRLATQAKPDPVLAASPTSPPPPSKEAR